MPSERQAFETHSTQHGCIGSLTLVCLKVLSSPCDCLHCRLDSSSEICFCLQAKAQFRLLQQPQWLRQA